MIFYIITFYSISFVFSESHPLHFIPGLNPNPISFRPKEIKFESLPINDEEIITTSRPIDTDAELSAISRKTYKDSPKPESVRLTHDLASEIERLRNINFEEFTKETTEPELSPKDGVHIKKPLSEPGLDLKRIDDDLIIYTNPLAYVPTFIMFLISLPSFSYFLVGGKEQTRYSIPAITGFVTYFMTYNLLRSMVILSIVIASIVAVFSYSIALWPVKYFKIGPRGIRKEPVGWVLTILFSCAVFSNLVYKVLFTVFQLIVGGLSIPRFIRAVLPAFYMLFLLTVSSVVLTLLILVIPTRYAQNSVLSLSCSYILLSCVSFLNDFLVYKFSARMKPLQFDLTQFFNSNVVVSVNQILMVLGTLVLALGTTFFNTLK